MAFFIGGVCELRKSEIILEELKNQDVENNPFAGFPKPLIEKALEVIVEFAEEIKLD